MHIRIFLLFGLLASLVRGQVADADLPAVAQAEAHLRANAETYGLADARQALKARKARRDERGETHIRFDQFYRGVKVFEGEAIAHVGTGSQVTVTDAIRRGLNLDVTPAIQRPAALNLAVQSVGARGPFQVLLGDLAILPKGDRSATDLLTWHFRLFIENEIDETAQWDVFVDGNTGAIAFKFNSLETSASVGTGQTMFIGTVSLDTDATGGTFYLRDTLRSNNETRDMRSRQNGQGLLIEDSQNIFGDSSKNNTDPDTAGADAHYGMSLTLNYYKTSFGRNGIDNNNRKTYSRVHYGRSYENAFWSDSCFCMTYGDGASTFYPLVSLDVAGHELSHGVMSTEADLTYSGESGGLNEANSDIFGTMAEFFANSSTDVPEYWIGERIYRSNYSSGTYVETKALRYMSDPAKDGRSPACWSSSIGGIDVHYSSGPANHMFFLLAQGGTSKCNGAAVTGIGRTKAAGIWYKAVVDYMTASTKYSGAKSACLQAATALYGSGSPEYNAVNSAFAAINLP